MQWATIAGDMQYQAESYKYSGVKFSCLIKKDYEFYTELTRYE